MDKTDMDARFHATLFAVGFSGSRIRVTQSDGGCGRRTSGANYRRGISSVLRSTACRGECHKFGAGCRTVAGMYIVCFFGALFSLRENSSLCRLDCPKEDTEGRCRLPRSVPEGVGAGCRPVAGGRYRSCHWGIGRRM